MRMRRKSNLDERMSQVADYFYNDFGEALDTRKAGSGKPKFFWKEIFCNDNPVFLEVGCGKGAFINETALKNPDKNYIALEKITNVIIEAAEKTRNLELNNLKYLNTNCENLLSYINPSELKGIFINFPNPLPNKRNERQRLTSSRFLDIYKVILQKDGNILLRTDDLDFFGYTLENIKLDYDFIIDTACFDLHSEIATEHEKKFISQGKKIMGLSVYYGEKNVDR